MPAVNVKSDEWRHLARSVLTSATTPLVLFEFTIGTIRADAIAFDPWKLKRGFGPIRILEVKSSRADFKADKKWSKYLDYCTQFAFLAPDDAIKPDELPAGVGLFVPTLHQWKHKYDAYDGSYKAGEIFKETIEPKKIKQWKTRSVETQQREVILERLIRRGIAEIYYNQHKAEKLYYGCDPDYLATLEKCEKAA